MAPFTHASPDRPSRFSDGRFGVLYVARDFETALHETIHHHALFMRATREKAGWTSQFRELTLDVAGRLTDLRGSSHPALARDDYTSGQALGAALRRRGSDGVVYGSVRHAGGECAGLLHPDLAARATQGRHLDYHWDGTRVDLVREGGGRVFRIV
jgi:hypothetical protein